MPSLANILVSGLFMSLKIWAKTFDFNEKYQFCNPRFIKNESGLCQARRQSLQRCGRGVLVTYPKIWDIKVLQETIHAENKLSKHFPDDQQVKYKDCLKKIRMATHTTMWQLLLDSDRRSSLTASLHLKQVTFKEKKNLKGNVRENNLLQVSLTLLSYL